MTEDASALAVQPPGRRLQPADLALIAALASGLVGSYVLAALTPSLLRHHVVLLEALAGSVVSIVTGGALSRIGELSLAPVVLAPLCGVALYDVFVWWAGRRWGSRAATVLMRHRPRTARTVMKAEALVRRRGVWALAVAYYLPFPNALVYLLCGTSGMPLWTFVVGDAIGTMLWVGLLVGLGWSIGHPAVSAVNTIDHHALQATVGLVVVWLVAVAIMRARRRSP